MLKYNQLKTQQERTTATETRENVGFNPYIHGTNSAMLSLLEQTNFKMMSVTDMLEQYGVAPMSGEINGGISSPSTKCMPCFAKFISQNENSYNFTKVLKEYSKENHNTWVDSKELAKKLGWQLMVSESCNYSNIRTILVALARAKQMGVELPSADLRALKEELYGHTQSLYLLLLIGNQIYPRISLFNNSEKGRNTLSFELKLKQQIKFIKENAQARKIDLEEIYNNPTKENLELAIEQLKFPDGKVKFWGDKVLPSNQMFSLEQDYEESDIKSNSKVSEKMTQFFQGINGNLFHNLLSDMLYGNLSPSIIEQSTDKIIEEIRALKRRAEVLDRLMQPSFNTEFDSRQKHFFETQFPIILVCEKEKKISIYELETEEYRANDIIRIGDDIKMIATDNKENRMKLMCFLEDNQIFNVKVVLFDDLEQSLTSQKSPESPYAHKDGFPKLSWMAAKVAASIHDKDSRLSSMCQKSGWSDNVKSKSKDDLDSASTYYRMNFNRLG